MNTFSIERRMLWLGVLGVVLVCWPVANTSTEPVTAVAFNRFMYNVYSDWWPHFYRTGMDVPTGWQFEGVEGYVSPVPRAYTVPLYRFYQASSKDHFYTASEVERVNMSKQPYAGEGVAAQVVPADRDLPGTVPLYRFTRRRDWLQDHFYSLNPTVPAKFIAEGVCCRVWKAPVQLPDALLRISDPGPNEQWTKGSIQTIAWEIWTGSGVMRLLYSTNGGQSWSPVGEVQVPHDEGVVANGSFSWPLPPTLTGTVRVRLDWVSNPGHTPVPWASVQTGDIRVVSVLRVPPRRK